MTNKLYKNKEGIYKIRDRIPSRKVMGDTKYVRNHQENINIEEFEIEYLLEEVDRIINHELLFGQSGVKTIDVYGHLFDMYFETLVVDNNIDRHNIERDQITLWIENNNLNKIDLIESGWDEEGFIFYAVFDT